MTKDYQASSRLYIIPQDEETRISLLNADRNSKVDLRRHFGIHEEHDWQCNTIATCYLELLIKALAMEVKHNGNADATINFYDLFTVFVTVKRNANAEKEGNINIVFVPGTKAIEMISDETPREDRAIEYVSPEAFFTIQDDNDMTALFLKIDSVSKLDLQHKYGIAMPHSWIITAIAYTFMENIFRELLYKLAMEKTSISSINFNDTVEMHAIVDGDGGVKITMRPGMNAKLIIKSDESTESDDGEDDDD